MPQAIASLPPTARFVDYSAEIPGLESETIESANLWAEDEGFSFSDFLDVVNPLQHIPVISSIYRAVTGDEISLGARLLGGALFGGPLGVLTAGVNAAFEEIVGGNIAEQAASLFEELTGSDEDKPQLALEPQAVKSEIAAAPAPLAPASQPAPAQIDSQTVPIVAPAPTAILAPMKPPARPPAVPAMNAPPAVMNHPQQGAMQLPATLNAPPRNSIALFNGTAGDATTQRISQSILDGQRAQAQLLLASLSGGNGKSGMQDQAGNKQTASAIQPGQAGQAGQAGKTEHRQRAMSAARQAVQATARAQELPPKHQSAHPNLPPSGAPSAWFQQAMDSALNKYQSTQGLNRAGGIPAPTGK